MKLKLIIDENIPESIILKLNKSFEIISIREKYRGMKDKKIIELSKNSRSIIITMDKGFGRLIYSQNLKPFSLILIRIYPQSPEVIYSAIKQVLNQIINNNIVIENKFLVTDGNSLRIRKF